MMKILSCLASALLLTSTAFAQEAPGKAGSAPGKAGTAPGKAGTAPGKEAAAPSGPPAPAPEFLTATKFFLGSWNCAGTQAAGPWGPEAKSAGKLGFKMDLNNFFMSVDGNFKMGENKQLFRGVNGYDPTTKKLMRMDWDSMGGAAHLSSPGWEGDVLTFTGEGMMMGQKMKLRHTMTKKGDKEFTSVFEYAPATAPGGTYSKMGEDVCKKGPGK